MIYLYKNKVNFVKIAQFFEIAEKHPKLMDCFG